MSCSIRLWFVRTGSTGTQLGGGAAIPTDQEKSGDTPSGTWTTPSDTVRITQEFLPTGPDADPCNPESLNNPGGQGHIPMFNALLENEEFWATYINRWADLSNTHFSCDNMHAVLDSMIAVIDPEMPRQIERWEGNYAAWQENVQEIHDFIDERCAETLIGGIEDCYDVESVTLTIIIDGLGQIEVNSVDIGPYDMPLDATYFAGVPMALEAQEEYGELFLFWDVLDGDVSIVNPTNPNLNFTLNGDATIVAYFAANADPQEVVFDVNPPGAGDIVLDGAMLSGYPSTQTLDYGAHSVEAIGLDEWHVFTGWTTTGTAVTPSAVAVEGGISITQAATVTANFEVIEHVDLIRAGGTCAKRICAAGRWRNHRYGRVDRWTGVGGLIECRSGASGVLGIRSLGSNQFQSQSRSQSTQHYASSRRL